MLGLLIDPDDNQLIFHMKDAGTIKPQNLFDMRKQAIKLLQKGLQVGLVIDTGESYSR